MSKFRRLWRLIWWSGHHAGVCECHRAKYYATASFSPSLSSQLQIFRKIRSFKVKVGKCWFQAPRLYGKLFRHPTTHVLVLMVCWSCAGTELKTMTIEATGPSGDRKHFHSWFLVRTFLIWRGTSQTAPFGLRLGDRTGNMLKFYRSMQQSAHVAVSGVIAAHIAVPKINILEASRI